MTTIFLIPFLLASLVQAGSIAPKVVTCGDHGTSQTNIDAGEEDYYATVSIPKDKGPTFQIHAKVSLKTGFLLTRRESDCCWQRHWRPPKPRDHS
jgi:hypothetical protein